jgi:V/A-type H+/Na+-transporting ATPase subunit I
VIARMEKLFIVGAKKLAPNVLSQLQQAGVVQIDSLPQEQLAAYRLEPEDEDRLKQWEAVAISADHAKGLLGAEVDDPVVPFQGELAAVEAAASSYESQAAALVARREQLKDEVQLVEHYNEVTQYLAEIVHGLDNSTRLSVIRFLVEKTQDLEIAEARLNDTLDDRYLLTTGTVGKLVVAIIITLKRDADAARGILAHEGLHELPRLEEYGHMDLRGMAAWLQERSERAPQELAATEAEIERLREAAGRELKSLWTRGTDEAGRLQILRAMSTGRYGFALFGWVPANRKHRVTELLEQLGEQVLYTFEAAEEHDKPAQVPVLLENPDWVKPFEAFISFLNTPRYDSWDPTWITAALFPLWVGMVIGDIGYGLVFAGLALYLQTFVWRNQALRIDFFKIRLAPDGVAQLVRIMKPLVVWTIIWGLIYGECFGNLLQRLGVFRTEIYPGVIPTLIPRTETATTATLLILISIGFGVFQVLHGFALKAKMSREQGSGKHFWEGSGYFGGVAGLVLFGYAFMTHSYPWWMLILIVASFILFAVGIYFAKMPLMIAELPTQGGHILSYIRIYAVGLASAILANLATDIGFGLFHGGLGVVLGLVIGVVLGVLVHTLLLILLTVSHVLQPIRLIWVEFFTKFDFYTLSGRPYRPFKLHDSKP